MQEHQLDHEVLEQTEIQVKYSGYIEKEKNNANEKSQIASKMAAISAQRALDLANQSARNRERTINAFTGNNIPGLTKLQSIYRRNKQRP